LLAGYRDAIAFRQTSAARIRIPVSIIAQVDGSGTDDEGAVSLPGIVLASLKYSLPVLIVVPSVILIAFFPSLAAVGNSENV
jgi:hypothetical protein